MNVNDLKIGDKVIEFKYKDSHFHEGAIKTVSDLTKQTIKIKDNIATRTYRKSDLSLSTYSNQNYCRFDGYIILATESNINKLESEQQKIKQVNKIRDFFKKDLYNSDFKNTPENVLTIEQVNIIYEFIFLQKTEK